jgi:hypothetical protein
MTLEALLDEVRALSVEERKQLVMAILDSLTEDPPQKKRSLLELEGLGKDIWEGVDAQEYVNELRREWDHRP